MHDVALQKLPVRFAMDRAGLVGEDGPTQAGAYDVTFMACLPDMVVMSPMNEAELCHMVWSWSYFRFSQSNILSIFKRSRHQLKSMTDPRASDILVGLLLALICYSR